MRTDASEGVNEDPGVSEVMQRALGQIDSAWSLMLTQVLESRARAKAAVEAADQRIADAETEAQIEVQRARLEAQTEIADLRTLVDQLRGELQAQRDRLRAAPPASRHGESGVSADVAASQIASYRAQLFSLTQELETAKAEAAELGRRLDAEKAKRARLIAAVQSLHQPAMYVPVPVNLPVDVTALAAAPAPAVETTVDTDEPGAVVLNFNAEDYARQLLDDIERVYAADFDSGLAAGELVEKLIVNLTYASDVFGRRVGFASPQSDLFDKQLTTLLDLKGGTIFGRHLAVAAYDYEQRRAGCEQVA